LIAYTTRTQKVIEPLPHQQRILEELKMFNKALVHIPSGAGKTHTAAFDVRNKKPKTFLYISHRNEINTQAIKIFKEICGIEDHDIGIINRHKKQFDKPFLFATIQTISRTKHIRKISKTIEYVVIDEFHHAAAKTYRKIINYLQQTKTLLGLTATPDRMDAQDVRELLDNNVVGNIDIIEGIKNKILISFQYRAYWDNVNYNEIKWRGHGYREKDLDKVLLIPERDKKIIETYKETIEPDNRQTIAFCATIKHVKRMVEKFKGVGIKAEGITYKDNLQKRKEIIEQFRNGKIKVLFARDILNEGIDFPECEALMFLRPTMSETIFLQQIGRGLRKKRGKKPVLILDFISNYHNAFKIKSYLSKIIKTRPTIFQKGANFKPVYNLSYPIYELESQVIEMMELQEKMARRGYGNYTKQDLIDNYYNVKAKIKRQPTQTDMNNKDISAYSSSAYPILFGNWTKFLKSIGAPVNVNRGITDQDIIENFHTVMNDVGHVPTIIELEKSPLNKFHPCIYRRRFGSYSGFLKKINEKPNLDFRNYVSPRPNKHSFTELKKRYFDTKKELNLSENDFIPYKKWVEIHGYRDEKFIRDNHKLQWFGFLKKIGQKLQGTCSHCRKLYNFSNNLYRHKENFNKFCSEKCRYDYWKLKGLKFKAYPGHYLYDCYNCGKEFAATKKDINNGRKRYCSKQCITKYYNTLTRKKNKLNNNNNNNNIGN
jgi:superfamily II DNA or RNA helicase